MRTPAGKECRFFYGNYYRGRNREECRLLKSAQPTLRWTPDLCSTCPVPGILNANACQNMVLVPEVKRSFPFLKRQVRVSAHCTKNGRRVAEPQIGCGECHPVPPVFEGGAGDTDSAA